MRRVQAELGAGQMLALAPGKDFEYVVNWSPLADERVTWLLVTRERAVLVVPSVNAGEAESHMHRLGIPVTTYADSDDPSQILRRIWDWLGHGRIRELWVTDDARWDHGQALRDVAGGVAMGLASERLGPLRMVKTPEEIARMQASQLACDEGMRAGLAALTPGITEVEVQEVVRQRFLAAGAQSAAFVLVAFGPHTAHPHHLPDRTPLGPGPVWLDIGCYVDGYASDMTRTAYCGAPDTAFLEAFGVVEGAVTQGLQAVRPGGPVGAVDRACRNAIAHRGWAEAFVHRTGHGIGRSVHEPPSVTAANAMGQQVGMTFSVEPGVYFPGQWGIRLEEVVVVESGGAHIISAVPRTLFVIP